MSDKLLVKLKENNELENVCSIDNKGSSNICLPSNAINKINMLIVNHNNDQVCGNNDMGCINEKKEDIIQDISKKLGCSNNEHREICIINNISGKNLIDKSEESKIKFNYFKPFVSLNPVDWLSNDDIDMIQEQLYKRYKGYYYSYIHMVDLVMVGHSNTNHINHSIKNIKDINFYKEVANISDKDKISEENIPLTSYGIVCNTDPSSSGGQHWFSIYFNFNSEGSLDKPYTIEYFNSSGNPIRNNKFKEFFLNLENELTNKLQKCVKFIQVTNIQHQGLEPGLGEESGNCGVYSIYYIWSRLEGIPYTYFNEKKRILSDKIITEFRSKLFRQIE